MTGYKTIWEVPMVTIIKKDSLDYFAVMDMPFTYGFDYAYDNWKFNFDTIHKFNKAPFGIFIHKFWLLKTSALSDQEKIRWTQKALTYLGKSHNSIFTTYENVIEWMKDPKPYNETIKMSIFKDREPFKIDKKKRCPNK